MSEFDRFIFAFKLTPLLTVSIAELLLFLVATALVTMLLGVAFESIEKLKIAEDGPLFANSSGHVVFTAAIVLLKVEPAEEASSVIETVLPFVISISFEVKEIAPSGWINKPFPISVFSSNWMETDLSAVFTILKPFSISACGFTTNPSDPFEIQNVPTGVFSKTIVKLAPKEDETSTLVTYSLFIVSVLCSPSSYEK